MKILTSCVLAATLAGAAAAHSHHNRHHRHAKRDAVNDVDTPVVNVVTECVISVDVVYVLDGVIIDSSEAESGLARFEYKIIGETNPSCPSPEPFPATPSTSAATASPPPPSPSPSSSAAPTKGGQFIEKPSTTSAPLPATSISQEAPPAESTAETVPEPSSSLPDSAPQGLTADFPSGKVKCSEFPSKYGAVRLNWLGLGGWSGLQRTRADLKPGEIAHVETGTKDDPEYDECKPGYLCSYSCPPGYQKSQWPEIQSADGKSTGGLRCNDDEYLVLTKPEIQQLCVPGVGGVTIKNEVDKKICTCRTDYPGSEEMVIPICAQPNEIVNITNPLQTYYEWMGQLTSAQYYVNRAGLEPDEACLWESKSQPDSAGDKAPEILGVGTINGTVWIGLFENNKNATLDFNMEIIQEGAEKSECWYIDGAFPGGGTGCTASIPVGTDVTVRIF